MYTVNFPSYAFTAYVQQNFVLFASCFYVSFTFSFASSVSSLVPRTVSRDSGGGSVVPHWATSPSPETPSITLYVSRLTCSY